MKAVILAAGKSSRFYPFNVQHKSLFSLMGKPIIFYTIESVKKAGITDIIIIISPESAIPDVVGDGSQFGLSISYVVQSKPNGMGDALLCAKEHLFGEFFLLSAHRLDFAEYAEKLLATRKNISEIVLVGKRENVLGKYGVMKIDGDRIIDLVEKPKEIHPETDLRVLGNYLLNREFLEVLENIPPSHNHLEEAFATFASKHTARAYITEQESFSLKYPWDLFHLKNYVLAHMKPSLSHHTEIAESAEIMGNVIISRGVKIMENAVIKGPAYLGENVMIGNNVVVRNGTILEKNVKVGMNSEIKNAIIGEGSSVHSGSVEDSILGSTVKLGALFCTSNVRLDRTNVSVELDDKKVDSGLRDLGVIMGDNIKCGIRVGTMPGTIIGHNVIIGPATTVMKNISDNTTYYTKFSDIVSKKNHD